MRAPDALDADLDLLLSAAREGAALALSHWRQDPKVWDKGDGQGPVTEADLAVDALLRARLRAARPDLGWLSEESAREPGQHAQRSFVVDPIDGTRAFVAGEKSWSIVVAIVEGGRPVAGVVHLPALDRVYAARAGGGTLRDGQPVRVTDRAEPEGATLLANRATLDPARWQGSAPPAVHRHFRPSLAYRMALVAEGRFDGMMTLRDSWDWDIAAGALLVAEAGGAVTDREGAPLRFDTPGRQVPGVVAGSAPLVGALVGRLARAGGA